MQSDQLLSLILEALDDMKAENVTALDVRPLTDVTDHMVIATGRSDRHVRALTDEVVLAAKKAGWPPLGVEGEGQGEWVLVDLCDAVVHIMQPEIRDTYQLERLWTGTDDEAVSTEVLDTESR